MELFENSDIQGLIKAIVALENEEEAKLYLRDLLTSQELVEMAKRWKVARMLSEGSSYSTIEAETGLSSTTIARISKWLQSGTGGYRMMLRRAASLESKASGINGSIEVAVEPSQQTDQAQA